MDYLKIINPMDYKVALYIRLSKEDEKPGESESVSNQRSILTRYAKEQNLAIVGEYIDDGFSGTTFDRPEFKKMIQDIENKKINMVITKDLSRLGRDYIKVGEYTEKYFPEHRVRYISILDGVDTGIDSSNNDITPFKSVFNDFYAKDISKKIKSVKNNKQDLGLFIGGKAPYGYKLSNIPNKIEIDENVKPIVERIFKEIKSGKSCRAVAIDLTLDGIPTPSQYAKSQGYKISKISKHWADNRIRDIVTNEVYIGNMVQGRMKKINYKSKKCVRIPKENWKVVEHTHKAIIDKETFIKAQQMLETRKQTRVKTHDYLLKGLVYCHECGKKMGCSPKGLAEGVVYYFRCSTYTSYARLKLCTSHSIRMDFVENIVISKIKDICNSYFDKTNIEYIAKQKLSESKKNNTYSKELKNTNLLLNKIKLEIDNIYEDKLRGVLSQDDFERIYNRKKEEKESLIKKINKLKNIMKSNNIDESQILNKIIKKYSNNNIINRALLIDLIDRIEIDCNKKIYIYFKFKSLNNN